MASDGEDRGGDMSNNHAMEGPLRQRLAQLLERVKRIEDGLRSPHDRDWPERAIELENDDVLESLDESSLREVRQIRGALKRIEDGRYGVCATCGRAISAARLAAVPTAVTCVPCASAGRSGTTATTTTG
jgi:DnaK suppressor protein